MENKTRKFLIVGIITIIIVAVGVGAYLGFERSRQILPGVLTGDQGGFPINQQTTQGSGTGAPISQGSGDVDTTIENDDPTEYFVQQKERLQIITASPVVGYWVASSTQSQWGGRVIAVDDKGGVYEIEDVGKTRELASSEFGAPLKLVSNRQGSYAVVWFDSGVAYLFNLADATWEELGGIVSATFDPSGTQLAYLEEEEGVSRLYTKDLTKTTSNLSLSATLAMQDMKIIWPESARIYFIPRPSALYVGESWYVNLAKSTIHRFVSGNGLDLLGIVSGQTLVEQKTGADRTTNLFFVNESGEQTYQIPFSTLLDKCATSPDGGSLFCGVPYQHNKEFSFMLPDDYLQGAVYFKDYVYRIKTDGSGVSPVINLGDVVFDAVSLSATPTHLLFLNRLDGNIYAFLLEEEVEDEPTQEL